MNLKLLLMKNGKIYLNNNIYFLEKKMFLLFNRIRNKNNQYLKFKFKF